MRDSLPPLAPGRKFHQMADEAEATIARLTAERDAASTKAERKQLNQRIHSARMIERFIRSRRGYADEELAIEVVSERSGTAAYQRDSTRAPP